MKKILYTRLLIIGIWALFFELFVSISVKGQFGTGWKVWVKTSPCSGRTDWISVAKSNPTGGGNFFYLASDIFPGTGCTNEGCTYLMATAVAATLRISSQFSKYCCREYSVWRNDLTGNMTVVVGKFGTAGTGWSFVKGDLCCEEAETLAGIPGACSGRIKNTQPKPQNLKCWPGSHAEYNSQTKRTECFCNPGLVWNSTKTACVDPGNVNKGNNNGTKHCSTDDAAKFAKLMGSWKSYRMQITIGGSCDQVTGTWKVTEWCEGVDATDNPTTARINGTFTGGSMRGGSLQLNFQSPPSPHNSAGTKGTGSCYLQSKGTLSCSGFGCSGDLKKE